MKGDLGIYQVKCPKYPRNTPLYCFYPAQSTSKTPL